MKNPTPLLSFTFKAIPACLLLTLLSACAHYSLMTLQDELQTNIYQFNKRLDGKMMDLSAGFVSPAKRKDFLINSKAIKDKVTFYDRSIVDTQYLDGDQPVKITAEGPEKEFDKAIVTIQYQISVLPSNQLKAIMLDQIWVLNDEQWQVEPDLGALLE
jgi:hypothetical protein